MVVGESRQSRARLITVFVIASSTHRTVRAFSMVSAVVNVLETTTAMVVAGSRPFSARATSTGSTLARNRSVRPFDSFAEVCEKQNRNQL